jgi:kumamolisin
MPDESGSSVRLAGSERASLPDVTETAPLDTQERAEITLVLRRRAELPEEIVAGPTVLTADQLAEGYGADPADVDLVRRELGSRGLEVTAVHAVTRRVKVAGTLGDLSSAFGTTLRQVSSPDPRGGRVTHRYREGPLFLPAALDGVVTAVLGLDTRPQAQPRFRTQSDAAAAQGTSYPPNQVADIYSFPAGTTGAGQTVAVIELGGGFTTSDLDTYFGGLGIATPSITAASVDGASNNPGDTSGASVEVNLDIDVIGAAAPGAAQVVYFAPNNGDQGFVDAISNAAQASPAPIAISISWGQSEDSWTAQGMSAMNQAMSDAAALGITVCAAAGDNGSSDGVNDGQVHVDFPASSPYALGCGGTKLLADPATGVVSSEVVWNELASNEGAGGGGVSDQFALPSWQANAGVGPRATAQPAAAAAPAAAAGTADPMASEHRRHNPSSGSGTGGRGVPDVAGNADPVTGYQIYQGGQAQVVGGTSAVAPLWSALIARLAQATGKRFGLIQPLLYAGASSGTDVHGFRDITSGNNGAYAAGPGWDSCTGLGVPDGTALLSRLQGS